MKTEKELKKKKKTNMDELPVVLYVQVSGWRGISTSNSPYQTEYVSLSFLFCIPCEEEEEEENKTNKQKGTQTRKERSQWENKKDVEIGWEIFF